MLREQFLASSSDELVAYFKEKKAKTFKEMAEEAENFRLAHPGWKMSKTTVWYFPATVGAPQEETPRFRVAKTPKNEGELGESSDYRSNQNGTWRIQTGKGTPTRVPTAQPRIAKMKQQIRSNRAHLLEVQRRTHYDKLSSS